MNLAPRRGYHSITCGRSVRVVVTAGAVVCPVMYLTFGSHCLFVFQTLELFMYQT